MRGGLAPVGLDPDGVGPATATGSGGLVAPASAAVGHPAERVRRGCIGIWFLELSFWLAKIMGDNGSSLSHGLMEQ